VGNSQDNYQETFTGLTATDSSAERLHIDIHGRSRHQQQKIWQLSHRTDEGLYRDFFRKSGSGSRSVGKTFEEMTGNLAIRNHTKCGDLRNIRKSK